jgi:hypothetical protein
MMRLTVRTRVFEELSYHETELGELVLRRRTEPRLDDTLIYEVKLGDEFLMSSLFTVGERALATLGLARLAGGRNGNDGTGLDVIVGGLGLGYTAVEALKDPRVHSLVVVDALGEVINWHRTQLVPLGQTLTEDSRCRLVCGDFFALAKDQAQGFDHAAPGRQFDAILLDIDHSTEHWLHAENASFYGPAALAAMAHHLVAGGVFAMWSDASADAAFIENLRTTFVEVTAERVAFDNPYTGGESDCTIYIGRKSA